MPARCSLPLITRLLISPLLSLITIAGIKVSKLNLRLLPMLVLLGWVFSAVTRLNTGMTVNSNGLGFSHPILCMGRPFRTVNQVLPGLDPAGCEARSPLF